MVCVTDYTLQQKNVQSGTDNIIRKEVTFMRIMVDNLAVDVENKLVRRGEEDIRLTAKEYEVLKYLALHKDKVVSRAELLEHVWDCNYDCFSNVVDVYIRFLRAKIDDGHRTKLIKTFRKQGYSLTA
ncbi:MAG: winged helix-turn-helix domain-containing protein [Christensenella sp.]